MRLLLINDEIKENIQKVIDYAEMHVLEMDDLLDTYNKQKSPIGDIDEHCCYLPIGYKVVYSIERQNAGLTRHISISVDVKKRLPSIHSVEEIIKLFGFTQELFDCTVVIEEIGIDHQAINVLALK